jgi:hypothetical protein
MTPELVADSFVTLAGVLGLLLLGGLLRSDNPPAPASRAFGFAILVLLAVMLSRLVGWLGGWAWLGVVTYLAATLVPLAVLVITEALLRRHAPLGLKLFVVGGAVLLAATQMVPVVADGVALAGLAGFQVLTFAALGWLILRRDRGALAPAENAMVDRLALSFLLILPFGLSDFRLGPIDSPVRLSGIAILFLCWLAIGLRRQDGAGRPGEVLATLAMLSAGLGAAALAVAAVAGLDLRQTVQVTAIFAAAVLLVQIHLGVRQLRREAAAPGLVHYLATAPVGDPGQFLSGLRLANPALSAVVLGEGNLGDFDARFTALFRADPLLARRHLARIADPAAAEQAAWFFTRFDATHAVAVSLEPLRLLAVNVPALTEPRALEDELRLVYRLTPGAAHA